MLYMVAFVYIVSGEAGTLHVDVTMSLMQAMWVHKTGADPEAPVTDRCEKLVYYERCHNIRDAHARKEELTAAARPDLEAMIQRRNPGWDDLSAPWFPIASHGLPLSPTAIVELPAGKITAH